MNHWVIPIVVALLVPVSLAVASVAAVLFNALMDWVLDRRGIKE